MNIEESDICLMCNGFGDYYVKQEDGHIEPFTCERCGGVGIGPCFGNNPTDSITLKTGMALYIPDNLMTDLI